MIRKGKECVNMLSESELLERIQSIRSAVVGMNNAQQKFAKLKKQTRSSCLITPDSGYWKSASIMWFVLIGINPLNFFVGKACFAQYLDGLRTECPSGEAYYKKAMGKMFWLAFWGLIFLAFFMPVFVCVSLYFRTSIIDKMNQIIQEDNEIKDAEFQTNYGSQLLKCKQDYDTCQNLLNQTLAGNWYPQGNVYFSVDVLDFFIAAVQNKKASTMKELVHHLDTSQHRNEMERKQEQLLQEIGISNYLASAPRRVDVYHH